jgi:Tol biopolymer transport system component
VNKVGRWIAASSAMLAAWLPSPVLAQKVAPDGRIVFASDADGDWDIWVMNADGSGAVNLTSDGEPEGGWQDTQPSWSQDGTRIVFASTRVGGDTDIFVMNPDGQGLSPVTANDVPDYAPDWSPNGSRIVFTSERASAGEDDSDIFVVGADGSGVTNLSAPFEAQVGQFQWLDKDPKWSPVSDRIVFASGRAVAGATEGAYWRIVTMDPDGSDQVVVSNPEDPGGDPFPDDSPNFDEFPEWSPNGAWIAFATHQQPEQQWDIQIVRADGTDQQYVINDAFVEDMGPTWSPSGTQILFASNRGGDGEMALHSVDVTGRVGSAGTQRRSAATLAAPIGAVVGVADPDQFGRLRCTIRGTAAADQLTGTPARDIICANGGNDTVRSAGGRDVVYGAGGSDVLIGGWGDDILYGGAGADTLRGDVGVDSCVDIPNTRRTGCEH